MRFFTGIRGYFAEHCVGNATLADLLARAGASSGRNLADWSKAWLETAGPNTLRSEFETGPDGKFTWFAVLQEAPEEHPTLRPHRIAIGLYNFADGAPGPDASPERWCGPSGSRSTYRAPGPRCRSWPGCRSRT